MELYFVFGICLYILGTMEYLKIQGWDKLSGVYHIKDNVTVDVSAAFTKHLIDEHNFLPKTVYFCTFSILHLSRGKFIDLTCSIKPTGPHTIEITVKDPTINSTEKLQNKDWIDLKDNKIFKTPNTFVEWLISYINKQHRYYIP